MSEVQKSKASGCMAVAGLVVSILFLANFTLGIFELPDNLPLIGNLDELFFSGVLFWSLAQLGIPLPFNRPGRRDIAAPKSNDSPNR